MLELPNSRSDLRALQRERLATAFERARKAPWYQGKLDHIDAAKLSDPEEWQKIPVIDKDTLRELSHADFMDQLCIAKREDIAEYWRSGGTTGRPLFYPRTFEDVRAALLSWHRSFPLRCREGRRSLPYFVSARHPPGRANLGAERARPWHWHELGRRWGCHAVRGAAFAHRND